MICDTDRTMELVGQSGKRYLFNLYSFDNFDDLRNAFNTIAALYVFTKRFRKESGNYSHDLIYLGETSNLSERFDNHHKESCIKMRNPNCIGIYSFVGTEQQRKNAERDILESYDFPCNSQNN